MATTVTARVRLGTVHNPTADVAFVELPQSTTYFRTTRSDALVADLQPDQYGWATLTMPRDEFFRRAYEDEDRRNERNAEVSRRAQRENQAAIDFMNRPE